MNDSPHLTKWSLRFISLLVFAICWEISAHVMHSLLFPGFTETIVALAHLLTTRALWDALWVSNQAMVLGFSFAAIVGVFTGVLMGRFRAAEKFIDPYLSILLVTPKAALIPIIIMVTGLGIVSRVFIVFTFALVVIVVHTRAGLRTIDAHWIEMAQSFGASELQLWRKIFLRGALPAIATGLRLGLARAVTGMLTVELLLLAVGLGQLILVFQGTFDAANLYATVGVITAEAVFLMRAAKWLEQRAAPWAEPAVVE